MVYQQVLGKIHKYLRPTQAEIISEIISATGCDTKNAKAFYQIHSSDFTNSLVKFFFFHFINTLMQPPLGNMEILKEQI